MKSKRLNSWLRKGTMRMMSVAVMAACLFSSFALLTMRAAASPQAEHQSNSVTGQVLDPNNEPLVGVSVEVVGSDGPVRAITDIDGMFTINLGRRTAELKFSYIGFKEKTVKATAKTLMRVSLDEQTGDLDEVVVTGYTTQKKASIIGAIETVRPEEITFGNTRTLSNNLAGKISGIIGIQRSGEPGYDDSNFWIRGISSFSNGGVNKPLILIDGIERDLDNLDVAEIESFSVLKDASASAMYGVRGANGVIVITTKRGKIGAPQVRFHIEHAINEPTMFPKFLNAPDYMTLMNEVAAADPSYNGILPFEQLTIDRTRSGYDQDLYPDVNWIDAITKDYAYTTRGNVDISGGSDFLRYSIVASYFKESGILEQDKTLVYNNATNNQQYNLRSNIDMDVTKTTLLRVNIGGYLNRFKKQRVSTNDAFSNAFATLPFVHPIRYSDGAIPLVSNRANPWRDVTQGGYDFITSSKLQTMFSVEQNLKMITPGLKVKAVFSFDRWNQSARGRTANSPTVYPATGRDEYGNLIHQLKDAGDESLGSYSGAEGYGNTQVYFEANVSYDRRFGKSDISSMLLYNQSAYDDGSVQDYRKQGIAGRVSYTYDNRYVAEFNFGYNGSENFEKGKRYGFFPSGAIGWLMSEEHWMDNLRNTLSKIKFRASIGQAGSSTIGGRRFAYITTLNRGQAGYTWGTTGQRRYSGITEGEIGVSNLTWETVTKTNFGIELGLWNMLDLNFDIFRERRKNIFMRRTQVPTQTGFNASPWANFGKVDNGGVEMSINMHKQWNNDWFTSFYGNFTYAKNRVVEYDEAAVRKGTHRAQTGRSLNELWGLTADRLFVRDDFDITTDSNGKEIYKLKFGIPSQEVGKSDLRPGDVKYIDMNGDSIITEEDEGYIGGTIDPRIVYGFGAVVSYKHFDLNFFFQGAGDTYRVIGGSAYFIPSSGTTTQGNAYAHDINNRWIDGVNEDPHAFWPRLYFGPQVNNYRSSTWWKKNMSFLRCKTIEVGYTLPKDWLKSLYVKNCRVFVSGNNLFCLTGFKLWDPELGTNDGLKYPMNRSVIFGVDVNF